IIKKVSTFGKPLLKMLTVFALNPEELNKLNYERYHYPCPLVQKRFHCLYLKAAYGLSNEETGRLMDAHRNSVSQWVKAYQQGGYGAIIQVGYGTNQSILESHSASIVESFTTSPPRSLDEAVLKVRE